MATNDKDTIYIDIDDEITGIIDKLRASNGKIVALVLPKRASVFQSIVNMKLLKRAADDAKKHLVLITSEAGLLPLAGAAGVHVAKTLTSKPEVPGAPEAMPEDDDVIEEITDTEPEEITVENAGDEPVGKLAGLAATGTAAEDMETLELDNEETPATDAAPAAAVASKKLKKDKKLAVPNFERFRLALLLGGGALVLLILVFIIANAVLPKAIIKVSTDAQAVNADLNVNLSTTAQSVKLADNTIPAKLAKEQKTFTQQVPATGQQNNGNKATGSVTITNCSGGDVTLPAGVALSSNSNTYITQGDVTVPDSNYKITGQCKSDGKASVGVIAQKGGANYNLSSGATFAVSASSSCPSSCTSHLSGQGGTISGGTDNIVTVVSESDIANAKSKISINDGSIKQTLQNDLSGDNYFPIVATYTAGTPNVTSSSQVGDASSSVTITENINFTMFGARQNDLKALVDNAVKDQIDTNKLKILSEGLDGATFNLSSANDTSAQLSMHTSATAGTALNVSQIKQQAAGKRPGDVKAALVQEPGITDVSVKLSPFWVTSVPKKTSKITVTIAKPKPVSNNSNVSQ